MQIWVVMVKKLKRWKIQYKHSYRRHTKTGMRAPNESWNATIIKILKSFVALRSIHTPHWHKERNLGLNIYIYFFLDGCLLIFSKPTSYVYMCKMSLILMHKYKCRFFFLFLRTAQYTTLVFLTMSSMYIFFSVLCYNHIFPMGQ